MDERTRAVTMGEAYTGDCTDTTTTLFDGCGQFLRAPAPGDQNLFRYHTRNYDDGDLYGVFG